MIPEEKLEAARGRFERWFGRKGWFGYGDSPTVPNISRINDTSNRLGNDGQMITKRGDEDSNGRGKRIVLEVATAYVITKVLLPVRIGVCVWGTPWFAGVVGRVGKLGRSVGGAR